jgi:hypothetical protein
VPTNTNARTGDRFSMTNSASRLYDFLVKLKSTDGNSLQEILPKLLHIQEITNSHFRDPIWEAMQSITVVEKLISEVEQEICNCIADDEIGFYLKFIPGVCNALSPSTFGHPWNQIRSKITEVDLTRIEHLDRFLRPHITEEKIESRELNEVLTSVNSALDALDNSELPRSICDIIAFHLLAVRLAVEQYELFGINGIQKALAGYIGGLAMYQPVLQDQVDDAGKARLMDVVSNGNKIITLAKGASWAWPKLIELLQHVKALLPSN